MTAADAVAHADEMRVGLRGQVRRVWAPRGVKVRQAVERRYEWRYLALAVNGEQGWLQWTWLPTRQQGSIQQTVQIWQATGLTALVWDGAPSHRARTVQAVGMPLVQLPAAAPELNPAERVVEALRRAVEGRVYGTIEAKLAAVERELAALAAAPERVRRLAGWSWVHDAVARLPSVTALS